VVSCRVTIVQVQLIVDNIIRRSGILPSSTKIVCTHNRMLLAAADHVVVLQAGRIVASGDTSSVTVGFVHSTEQNAFEKITAASGATGC
jgi:ABC-type glutathione transport system ATPase component